MDSVSEDIQDPIVKSAIGTIVEITQRSVEGSLEAVEGSPGAERNQKSEDQKGAQVRDQIKEEWDPGGTKGSKAPQKDLGPKLLTRTKRSRAHGEHINSGHL